MKKIPIFPAKYNITQTTLDSYENLKRDNRIEIMQEKVLKQIKSTPNMTDREIANLLGYSDPNNIRPRRNELFKKGLIECNGKRKCSLPPNRLSYIWRIK